MDSAATFQNLGIALGLGLLVGLQRERVDTPLAGFRTFPLVTIFGVLCATLAAPFGGWLVAAGLIALTILIYATEQAKPAPADTDRGMTTEIALLVMYGVGACLGIGHRPLAVVVGGAAAILLYLKPQMHSLAHRIGDVDFRAIMQFVVISLVILPVLPNRVFGPFDVLNPHRIWWMVVLIVGISLGGYVVYKLFGDRVGVPVAGLLGGLISSTATTVSYARRSKAATGEADLAALVIMLASTVVFARVLGISAAVSTELFRAGAAPLGGMIVVLGGLSLGLWFRAKTQTLAMPEHANPSELKSAVVFGLLFALVLLATAAGKKYFGDRGLYAVAALSGLTDMDAITLSTAQMANAGQVEPGTAWRLILVAALSNLVFKGGAVCVLGDRALFRRIAWLFGVALAAGAAILAFAP